MVPIWIFFSCVENYSEKYFLIQEIALTKACTTGQPPDQCVDDNAVCDATASKCQCKSAYFVSKTSGTCKQSKSYRKHHRNRIMYYIY